MAKKNQAQQTVSEENVQVQEEAVATVSLFSDDTPTATNNGANQLSKTAQLTTVANKIANGVMQVITGDPTQFEEMVKESQKSHDAMDKLIEQTVGYDDADVDFLKSESDDTLEKMIRSQQSKRSRAKSKVMTRENYFTMLIGAVSENLLRIASGKPKSAGGGSVTGSIGYSEEELAELASNEDKLKKAIRNVQSKKSIMKSKADFDESSDRWQQLLEAESQLKSLRDKHSAVQTQKLQETESLLQDVDTDSMSAEESKELLAKVKEMLASR